RDGVEAFLEAVRNAHDDVARAFGEVEVEEVLREGCPVVGEARAELLGHEAGDAVLEALLRPVREGHLVRGGADAQLPGGIGGLRRGEGRGGERYGYEQGQIGGAELVVRGASCWHGGS